MACPTPSRKRPTNQPGTRADHGRHLIQSGRLRWLYRLPLVALRHATVSTVPRFQGQGRPPGQATGRGSTMTEASVSFAGNLTDDPEVRTPRAGSPGPCSGWRCRAAGSRSRRSSP